MAPRSLRRWGLKGSGTLWGTLSTKPQLLTLLRLALNFWWPLVGGSHRKPQPMGFSLASYKARVQH